MPTSSTLITPTEVNSMVFTVPITESFIKASFITAAEEKYLVPIVTKPIYDDLFLHASLYTSLLTYYIKPFLAFCTKRLLYSQFITESSYTHDTATTFPLLAEPSKEILTTDLQILDDIIAAKGEFLLTQLSHTLYPLYVLPEPPTPPAPFIFPVTLITPAEVNSLAFLVPIPESYILPSIISTAEHKFLIPILTHALYDDIFVNPSLYAALLFNYIKPYLAFCTKLLLYNQYYSENNSLGTAIPLAPLRLDDLKDLGEIITSKRQILEQHLSPDEFPLFVLYSKSRMNGFIISE